MCPVPVELAPVPLAPGTALVAVVAVVTALVVVVVGLAARSSV